MMKIINLGCEWGYGMSNAKIEIITPNYKIDSNSPFSKVLGRRFVSTNPSRLISSVLGYSSAGGRIELPPAPNGAKYWAVAQGTNLNVEVVGNFIYYHFTVSNESLRYMLALKYQTVLSGWVTYGLFKDIE